MSIEGKAQLRCRCSFRSATDYRSPINGLSEINGFDLFYKHCIPTGFPDRLLKQGVNEKEPLCSDLPTNSWRIDEEGPAIWNPHGKQRYRADRLKQRHK